MHKIFNSIEKFQNVDLLKGQLKVFENMCGQSQFAQNVNMKWFIGYQNMCGKVLGVQFDSFFEASCGIELTRETLSGMIAWQVEHK